MSKELFLIQPKLFDVVAFIQDYNMPTWSKQITLDETQKSIDSGLCLVASDGCKICGVSLLDKLSDGEYDIKMSIGKGALGFMAQQFLALHPEVKRLTATRRKVKVEYKDPIRFLKKLSYV